MRLATEDPPLRKRLATQDPPLEMRLRQKMNFFENSGEIVSRAKTRR